MSNNIENLASQTPKLYKRVYFIKPTGKPEFELDEDRDHPKQAVVRYEPPQILFDFEGCVRVYADSPQLMLGTVHQAQRQEIWKDLLEELQVYSDGYISGDCNVKVGDYYFYLQGMEGLEDAIGNIKRKLQSWQMHLNWVEDRLSGQVDDRGDNTIKDKVKVE